LNRVPIPTIDGSGKLSARAWVNKLDTYLSLKPLTEKKAIQFATRHLEGLAYEWWHHGLVSQHHDRIDSYDEFVTKLIQRFDRKDTEVYYCELAQLKQEGRVVQYVNEFQKIAVMVPDMTDRRITMLFIEGLNSQIKPFVKVQRLANLEEAIDFSLDLDTTPVY